MPVRCSSIYLGITGLLLLLLVTLGIHARYSTLAAEPVEGDMARLVGSLQLSGLCLFTEAVYTRHLAVTDLSAPFQETPFALDHFPAGSLAGPPQQVEWNHAPRH